MSRHTEAGATWNAENCAFQKHRSRSGNYSLSVLIKQNFICFKAMRQWFTWLWEDEGRTGGTTQERTVLIWIGYLMESIWSSQLLCHMCEQMRNWEICSPRSRFRLNSDNLLCNWCFTYSVAPVDMSCHLSCFDTSPFSQDFRHMTIRNTPMNIDSSTKYFAHDDKRVESTLVEISGVVEQIGQ